MTACPFFVGIALNAVRANHQFQQPALETGGVMAKWRGRYIRALTVAVDMAVSADRSQFAGQPPRFDSGGDEVNLAYELRYEPGIGRVIQRGRRPFLLQQSLVHHGDLIADADCRLLVVGDEHCGDSAVVQDVHDVALQLLPQLGIEVGKRLVISSMSGLGARARARATLCCCPPDS